MRFAKLAEEKSSPRITYEIMREYILYILPKRKMKER